MPKRSLRAQLLAQRHALTAEQWRTASLAAQQNVLALAEYASAASIALYMATRQEIATDLLLNNAFTAGKRVFCPVVCGSQMIFRQVEHVTSFQEGAFGILEPCPAPGEDYHADEPDLIVVPGVAFDLTGHRLGYGKGFYDRFLHHPDRSACLVGLCHDFQLRDQSLPVDGHDVPMDIVVSDARIVRTAPAEG